MSSKLNNISKKIFLKNNVNYSNNYSYTLRKNKIKNNLHFIFNKYKNSKPTNLQLKKKLNQILKNKNKLQKFKKSLKYRKIKNNNSKTSKNLNSLKK